MLFIIIFNQYQVGPTALLNNMNSLNSLLQAAWYWDFFFFCLLCRGAKIVFQVILVKKFESSGGAGAPPPSAPDYNSGASVFIFPCDNITTKLKCLFAYYQVSYSSIDTF